MLDYIIILLVAMMIYISYRFYKKSSVIVRMRLGAVIAEQHCYRCGKEFNKVNGYNVKHGLYERGLRNEYFTEDSN